MLLRVALSIAKSPCGVTVERPAYEHVHASPAHKGRRARLATCRDSFDMHLMTLVLSDDAV